MKSLNKVYLLGHLGQKPKLETSRSGRPFAFLNLATRRSWRTDEKTWEEHTDWHSVTVWGAQAEHCAENLGKGALVFVEGQLRPYAKGEGPEKETRLAVHASRVTYFTPRKDGSLPLAAEEASA